ncbi:hypothetical protein LguiA_031563 [Lonicera macranthoides]
MTVSTRGEIPRTNRRRRICKNATARIAIFILVAVFIFNQQLCSCSAKRHHHNSGPSSRKAQFFKTVSSYRAFYSPSSLIIEDQDKNLYGEDKRVVHTGPNPLHN